MVPKKIVADVLEAVRALFCGERAWTKATFARDKDGNSAWVHSEEACCWCLTGAIYRVLGDPDLGKPHDTVSVANATEEVLAEEIPYSFPVRGNWSANQRLMYYNDDKETGFGDIVGLVDKAIGAAQAA